MLTDDTLPGLLNRHARLDAIRDNVVGRQARAVPAAVTRSLKAGLMDSELLARSGSDEFVVLAEGAGTAPGRACAAR